MRKRRNPEVIAGKYSSATTLASGDGYFASYVGSAGAWVITITVPGFRLVGAVASGASGGGYVTTVSTFTDTSFRITNYDVNGAAVESPTYSFVAVGQAT